MKMPDLGQMVGPLPLGAWVAAVGGSVVVAGVMRRRKAEAEPVEVLGSGEVPYPLNDLYTYQGGAVAVGGAGAPAAPAAPEILNNTDWERAAATALIARGSDPYTAQQALRKYLRGLDPLNDTEKALVATALKLIGLPPQPPTVAPAAPPPTLAAPVVQPGRINGGNPRWCTAGVSAGPGPRTGSPQPYLKPGTTDPDIAIVQQAMRMEGFPVTDPPNVYGPTTAAAVKTFQHANGLNDGAGAGVIGRVTWCGISEIVNGGAFRGTYAK